MGPNFVEKHAGFATPSAWVERWAELVPEGSEVLDLACGNGRHGRLFLERGHPCVFLDKNISALSDLGSNAAAETIEADLEDGSAFDDKAQTTSKSSEFNLRYITGIT